MLHHHALEAPLVPSPYILRLARSFSCKMCKIKCIEILFIPFKCQPLYLLQGAFLILRTWNFTLPGLFFFTMGYNRGFNFWAKYPELWGFFHHRFRGIDNTHPAYAKSTPSFCKEHLGPHQRPPGSWPTGTEHPTNVLMILLYFDINENSIQQSPYLSLMATNTLPLSSCSPCHFLSPFDINGKG